MTEVDLTKTKMLPKKLVFRNIFTSVNPVWLGVVTPAGFEPAIFGMRTQYPEPLDEGAD